VKFLNAIFFAYNDLNLFILLIYDYKTPTNKIYLKEIKFFNERETINKYIKQKKLEFGKLNENEKKIIQNLSKLFEDYFSGKKIDLINKINENRVEILIDNIYKTEFSRKVIKYLINNIKYGKLATYSEIGTQIGSKAYRAIGNTLRNNPLPLIVPCHRIIRKDGSLGGFMGEVDDKTWQTNLKLMLLKIEGVLI
jgi:O-6-methylguanine DNA methyltransferase